MYFILLILFAFVAWKSNYSNNKGIAQAVARIFYTEAKDTVRVPLGQVWVWGFLGRGSQLPPYTTARGPEVHLVM